MEPAARPPDTACRRPSRHLLSGVERVEIPSEHVVVPGDNLWIIAERHLEQVTGRSDVSDQRVATYWVVVIEANQVRSGDPDLIYPGEVIVLPSVSQGES